MAIGNSTKWATPHTATFPADAVPPRQAEIPEQLDRLDAKLTALSDLIERLEDRLDPVLREPDDVNLVSADDSRQATTVGKLIAEAARRMDILTFRVSEILDRLEL